MAKFTMQATSKNVFESIAAEMQRRAAAATTHVERELVKKVSTPGPPRSTAGNPPNVDTARLRQSFQSSVTREGNTIRGEVSTNVEYAPHLEYGTRKMAARPFMRPTLAEQKDAVAAIMRTGKRK